MTNALGISGGGFYLAAMAHAAKLAQDTLDFNKIIGSSAGAVIACASAVLGAEKMLELAKTIDLTKAYKFTPFKPDGKPKLRAIVRFAFGKSLADHDGRELLKSIITKEAFEAYRSDPAKPDVFVLTVNIETGERHVWNWRQLPHNKAIDVLEGSTRMQGIDEPIEIDGFLHWDGGQLDHSPAHLLIDEKTTKLVSIYSRPKNWNPPDKLLKNTSAITRLFRMIEIDNIEKSRNDEAREREKCKLYGVKRIGIYTERHLAHSFDTNKENQLKAINSAIRSAKTNLKWLNR